MNTVRLMYELNTAQDYFTPTSKIVARFGGKGDDLGWGVQVITFDKTGKQLDRKVILRVLHDE